MILLNLILIGDKIEKVEDHEIQDIENLDLIIVENVKVGLLLQ